MKWFLILLSVLSPILISCSSSEKVRYDNYQIFQIRPDNSVRYNLLENHIGNESVSITTGKKNMEVNVNPNSLNYCSIKFCDIPGMKMVSVNYWCRLKKLNLLRIFLNQMGLTSM